jgi:hypothetical protein
MSIFGRFGRGCLVVPSAVAESSGPGTCERDGPEDAREGSIELRSATGRIGGNCRFCGIAEDGAGSPGGGGSRDRGKSAEA